MMHKSMLMVVKRRRCLPAPYSCVYHHLWSIDKAFFSNSRDNYAKQIPHRDQQSRQQRTRTSHWALNQRILGLGRQQKWEDILKLCERQSEVFNNVNFATAMSQLGRISREVDITHPSVDNLLQTVLETLRTRGVEWMGRRQTATILHAIGKMTTTKLDSHDHRPSSAVATEIIQLVIQRENASYLLQEEEGEEETAAQVVSNICWALAKFNKQVPRRKVRGFLARVDQRFASAETTVNEGSIQSLATLAWACAELRYPAKNLFHTLDKNSKELANHGKSQDIGNVAWAFAKLELQPKRFATEIDRVASRFVKEAKPQEVANTVWALAKMGAKAPNMVREINEEANRLVKEGRPQAVANTVWACAEMGILAPKLLDEIDKASTWLVQKGWPQHVANTAWAFASLGHKPKRLLKDIDKRSTWLVEEGNPQELANTAWAFATLAYAPRQLFDEIDVKASASLVKEGSAQAVSNTAWALAASRVQPTKLIAEIDRHAERLVLEGSPQSVANITSALAVWGTPSNRFMEALCRQTNAETLTTNASARVLVNLTHSLTILDDQNNDMAQFLDKLWNRLIRLEFDTLPLEELHQIVQIFAYTRARGILIAEPPMSSKDYERVEESSQAVKGSKTQQRVSEVLLAKGFRHEQEVRPWEEGSVPIPKALGLAIDMASREQKVAVEFDGPNHFSRVAGTKGNAVKLVENGLTRAKRRFLERLGWKVFNIAFNDWAEVEGNEGGEEELLRGILDAVSSEP